MNIGHSSKLIYDDCAFNHRVRKSTNPMIYKLDTNAIWNKQQCMSVFGPRSGFMGNGVGTLAGHPVATAQQLTDIESILTNRNVHTSQCKNGNLNPVNLTKLQQYNLKQCPNYLDPIASHLTHPAIKYREAPTDRFYDINNNQQLPIFWNFAVNTTNEAKDNFKFQLENNKLYDPTQPIQRIYRVK